MNQNPFGDLIPKPQQTSEQVPSQTVSTNPFGDLIPSKASVTNPPVENKKLNLEIKNKTRMDEIKDGWKWITDAGAAYGLGIEQSFNAVASTIAKAAASQLNPSLVSEIQKDYEGKRKEFEETEAVKNSPVASFFGQLHGSVASTPGVGAASGTYNAMKAAGSGTLLAGATALGAGAVENYAQGLITNTPGNKDVLNPELAQFNTMISPITSGLGIAASAKAAQSKAFSEALDSVNIKHRGKEFKYTADVFSRDLQDNFMSKINNQILDNIPWLGTGESRVAQREGFRDVTKQYVDYLVDSIKVPNGLGLRDKPLAAIQASLKKTHKIALETKSAIWKEADELIEQIGPKQSISSGTKDLSKAVFEDAFDLTSRQKRLLTTLTDNDALDYQKLKTLKADLWTEASSIGTKTSLGKRFNDIYRSVSDSIENSLNDNPVALQKYVAAKEYQQTFDMMFNPKKNPSMMKAINDKLDDLESTSKFVNWLTSGKRTEKAVTNKLSLLDQNGQDALQAKVMKDLYDKSFNGKDFDITKFVLGADQIPNTSNKLIAQEALESMKGLIQYVGNPNISALPVARRAKGMVNFGLGGAAMAAIHTGGTGVLPIALGIKAASKISTSSPLNRLLRFMNKVKPGSNVSEYLLEKIGDNINRLGLVIQQQEDGSIKIDAKESAKETTKQLMRDVTGATAPATSRNMPKGDNAGIRG